MKKTLLALALLSTFLFPLSTLHAQHDSIPESDPAILQRIDEWQDLKFSLEKFLKLMKDCLLKKTKLLKNKMKTLICC